MTVHRLKTWPHYFKFVAAGVKPFEVRINDRDFQWRDDLVLEEWDPDTQKYSGASIDADVQYCLYLKQYRDIKNWRWRLARWIMPDIVIMGIQIDQESRING